VAVKALDRTLQRLRIRQVAPWIERGARVLDIGCADGALLRAVPRIGSYVGIDPDAPADAPEMHARYLRGAFPHAALADEAGFDAVTALAVLEHVPALAQPRFAREVARLLRPGGNLLVTVPHPWVDPILSLLIRLGLLDGMETEAHYGFDPSRAGTLFREHGLSLVKHARFELGLNHLFVFRRGEARA
jgi:2-polyprenyl-3-methyl-5-hydroxy-6-metoxy-1,4-benzoquinol methylase